MTDATEEQIRALELLRAARENRFLLFRPYSKQREFFDLGATKNQRMFNAGNRLGKSDSGAFEVTCHATGEYPTWWKGWRCERPVKIWAAGLSALATRDISQAKLCGPANVADSLGTGLIPKSAFAAPPTLGRGITGAYDMVQVKHKSGGISTIGFKSYEQGWQKFQGESLDFVWLDEEPEDYKIYTECLTRLLDRNGRLIITYTPLLGETELYSSFTSRKDPSKGFVNMTGDDVLAEPHSHLTPDTYAAMVASWPVHERETRRAGLPTHGSGAVFTFAKEQIWCRQITDPPGHFRMGWGVDFGGMGSTTGNYSHPFGACLVYYDPLSDTIYVAHTIRLNQQTPLEHAYAMKRVCAAAPVWWPHDGHRHTSADSPDTTSSLYKEQGLRMWHEHATFKHGGYATETGILEMHQRFATGRLKVAEHLSEWWEEYRNYHRDEDGEIVKNKDDLMSATRIATMMAPRFAVSVPMGNLDGRAWKDVLRGPTQKTAPEWSPITGKPYE